MKTLIYIIRLVAIIGLVLILTMSVLYAWEKISFENYKLWLIIGSIAWFSGILISNRLRRNKSRIRIPAQE